MLHTQKVEVKLPSRWLGERDNVRRSVAEKCKHIILEGVQRGGRIVGRGRERKMYNLMVYTIH